MSFHLAGGIFGTFCVKNHSHVSAGIPVPARNLLSKGEGKVREGKGKGKVRNGTSKTTMCVVLSCVVLCVLRCLVC